VYRSSPADTDPCKSPCACFVIAQHVVKGAKGLEITEEKAYPGKAKKDGEADLLDEAKRKTDHPRASEPGGKPTDYWQLTAECLEVDKEGSPKFALGLELHLPKGQALALVSELKKRYGRGNVADLVALVSRPGRSGLWARRDASPAKRKPRRRRRKALAQ
jgi:hypothetical protein